MKKIMVIFIAVILISAISIFLYSYFTGNPSYPKSVDQTKIYSRILNEDRKIIIHLPRNYDKNKEYLVMYVLDGSTQDKHIANKLDILSTAGYIPETVVVGLPNVSAKGRQRDYTPPYMRMDIDEKDSPLGKADLFLLFMEKELIPFIEKNYSVSKIRSLAGHSRGGLLVMYSLLYKPDMFKGRFCFSPAFWRDDNLIVKKASSFLTENQNMNLFLYMSIGSEENDKMKSGFIEMIKTLNQKENRHLVWYSDIIKNADHQNNPEISASIGIKKWADFLQSAE
jgi:hypothetical protein